MDVNKLTKYERTKVIGMRAEQLARGAQAFVPLPEKLEGISAIHTFYKIAERELVEKKIPFIVVRQMLDGKARKIYLSE